jgi:HEAT repeats
MGTAQTPSAALIERALLGEASAAAEVIRRLAAGDVALMRAVSEPGNPHAERGREVLLHYLALGTWQAQRLPLPAGYHAGRDGQRLRDLITRAACDEHVPAWQNTLIDGLHDPNPVLRQTTAALLSECRKPPAVAALVATLSDRDEGVRWAAATALVRGGQAAVEAVLRRLTGQDIAPEMRHVAAYVLRHVPDLAVRQKVAPVVQALDGSDYRVSAPLAAGAALHALRATASS